MFKKIVVAAGLSTVNADLVLPVFKDIPTNQTDLSRMEAEFERVYDSFLADFPVEEHDRLMKLINDSVSSYLSSTAFVGGPGADCGSSASAVSLPSKMAAYPGGATKRVFGMDLAKLLDALTQKASGAASAQGVVPGMLAMQAIQSGAGMVEAAMNTVLQIFPRVVTGFPLTCMPMVTGHNCFGAVQYPITAADFATAATTDRQLDGVIASFPTLYKRKVGTTSDAAYKTCFSAYMGMQCASIFPRCSVPQAGNEPGPTGRLPMCASHCLATLVACPGMWIDDIIGNCMDVSVMPMCTISAFFNYWLLPPQYKSYEDSSPSSQSCPVVPDSLKSLTADYGVYDDSSIMGSPYGSSVPGA